MAAACNKFIRYTNLNNLNTDIEEGIRELNV